MPVAHHRARYICALVRGAALRRDHGGLVYVPEGAAGVRAVGGFLLAASLDYYMHRSANMLTFSSSPCLDKKSGRYPP